VPADDGVGFHEQDGVPQAPEAAGQCTEEPPIEAAPPRSFDLSADDDDLLAKEQVLGDQHCPGCEDGQDDIEQEAKEGDHGPERVPRWSVPGTVGHPGRAGGRVRGQVEDLAPRSSRHRRRNPIRSSSRTEYLRPTGGRAARRSRFVETNCVIGRDEDADLRLSDLAISRYGVLTVCNTTEQPT
jgi:hypothetical protein